MRLIDADRLLKEVEDGWVEGAWWVESIIEKAPTIIKTGVATGWISVKDRLPDEDEQVLVAFKRAADAIPCVEISFCTWASDFRSYFWSGKCEHENVTHWMQIPLPPESE